MNLSNSMIRGISMTSAFLGLLGCLYFLWQFRFEKIEKLSVVTIEDLLSIDLPTRGIDLAKNIDGSKMVVLVKSGESPVVARFAFPNAPAVEYLHLEFECSAVELKPGKEEWEDGRCIIEWHAPDSQEECENESIFTTRFNLVPTPIEMVVKPSRSTAVPTLRLENLGASGMMKISRFEATPVRQSLIWIIGRWIIVIAWLYWCALLINFFKGRYNMFRVWAASCIWLIMGIYCVVPGPWASYRPFGSPFHIGEVSKTERNRETDKTLPSLNMPDRPVSAPSEIRISSIGKIPLKGDLTLKIKIYAQKARTLLHIALLFGPTLLIACLVGRKPAFSLMVLMSLAIEVAEVAFGFGFDKWDIVDVLCNISGVVLALLAHYWIQKKYPNFICP